ncbi:unnamed protein product [Staurois parvus]|uniref:Uncharacterized protein n=1 Tax=Staurois parvus TaxID=386267 RepID=A0ABN9F815_9NEOB|nr:unnamed protein product [Staurois parvus]
MRGSRSAPRWMQWITDQRKEPKICVQSQLIAWDMYTDHQGTDDQCALLICVAPAVPPVSVHPYQLSVLIHATCQCPSVPHISAHLSCLTVSPISASQCHLSMPISATYQSCQSVPPISASQCHISVCISAV